MRPKLTVNVGVRYEFITNPTTNVHPLMTLINPPFGTFQKVPNVFASNPSLKNIDPRIGIAYDPFSDHKTAIRAGFGIFYDPDSRAFLRVRLLLQSALRTGLRPLAAVPQSVSRGAAAAGAVSGCGL